LPHEFAAGAKGVADMAGRSQRLTNQIGLSRIVIQDSYSHKTPQRDIVIRNWWPANRRITGMTALAPTIRLAISSPAAHFSINGPAPRAPVRLCNPTILKSPRTPRSYGFIARLFVGQVMIIENCRGFSGLPLIGNPAGSAIGAAPCTSPVRSQASPVLRRFFIDL
jgi:hypothetical protein